MELAAYLGEFLNLTIRLFLLSHLFYVPFSIFFFLFCKVWKIPNIINPMSLSGLLWLAHEIKKKNKKQKKQVPEASP